MNRKRTMILNSTVGIIKQFIILVCGFILPRYMLVYYGSSVNGLVSSITHFLGFITLMELGISPVIQANLYKPLAEKNTDQISKIIKSSERFFRRIAYVFLLYIVVLTIIYPWVIGSEFDSFYTISLLVIISISTFAQYYFGMTSQVLLTADQKAYVQLLLQVGTVVLNTIVSVVLMKCNVSVHYVKLSTSIIYLARPFGQMIYVKKHYSIDHDVVLDGEPIKQKWNGFAQHIAAVVCTNIDIVVLTVFSSLTNVSIYTVYYLVTSGITNLIMSAATGLEAMFGNMIAKKEQIVLRRAFVNVEFICHFVVTLFFSTTAVMIVPFVAVYTREITDTDYNAPLFALILVCAYGAQCLRIPYFRIIKAAGHFKETQNGAFISTLLNITISVVVVKNFGLVGVSIGTLVAMLYHTCYFVWYLKKHIICREIIEFVKYLLGDLFVGLLTIVVCGYLSINDSSYYGWFVSGLLVFSICLLIDSFVNILFHRKQFVSAIKMCIGKISQSRRK